MVIGKNFTAHWDQEACRQTEQWTQLERRLRQNQKLNDGKGAWQKVTFDVSDSPVNRTKNREYDLIIAKPMRYFNGPAFAESREETLIIRHHNWFRDVFYSFLSLFCIQDPYRASIKQSYLEYKQSASDRELQQLGFNLYRKKRLMNQIAHRSPSPDSLASDSGENSGIEQTITPAGSVTNSQYGSYSQPASGSASSDRVVQTPEETRDEPVIGLIYESAAARNLHQSATQVHTEREIYLLLTELIHSFKEVKALLTTEQSERLRFYLLSGIETFKSLSITYRIPCETLRLSICP